MIWSQVLIVFTIITASHVDRNSKSSLPIQVTGITDFSQLTFITEELPRAEPRWYKAKLTGPFQWLFLSFSLPVSSDGSSFHGLQSVEGWKSSFTLQHFFKCSILTITLWSSLITIQGSSAGESSHWHVLQRCGEPWLCFHRCLSCVCPSLFVHPLATSLLGFHLMKNLHWSSFLCAACLFQWNVSYSSREVSWILVTNLTEFTFPGHGHVAHS